MSKPQNELAQRLRAWRAASQLSQSQAAARLRAPRETYRNWETSRRSPSAAMLAAILAVVNGEERR